DAPGRAFHRDTGRDGGLAGRVLALAGGQDLAQDDFVDTPGLDPGTLHHRLEGDLAELMGRQVGKCPVEASDPRPCRADNDDIVLHVRTPLLWNGAQADFTV